MARYYIPFVNMNSLIHEPVAKQELYLYENDPTIARTGIDAYNLTQSDRNSDFYGQADLLDPSIGLGFFNNDPNTLGVQINRSEFVVSGGTGYSVEYQPFSASILVYKTGLTSSHNLSNEANIFTALNLKRNGPYGYSSWRQIRSHENTLIRNHKKKNIFTINQNEDIIETFKERPISEIFNAFEIIVGLYTDNSAVKYLIDLHNAYDFFNNKRINEIYSGYLYNNFPKTDESIKNQYHDRLKSLVNGRYINTFTHRTTVYPPTASIDYKYRIRHSFDFPWNQDFEDRAGDYLIYNLVDLYYEDYQHATGRKFTRFRGSKWPLDIDQDYKTRTNFNFVGSSADYNTDGLPSYSNNAGILQMKTGYLVGFDPTSTYFERSVGPTRIVPGPLYSYKHLITPMTSAVSPYGMDIEGINSGTLYQDLHRDHLISGEAYWDAANQYGKNPFPKDMESFSHDIKLKAKDYSIVPEFRSSMLFRELQDKPSKTPNNFLDVPGGTSHTTNIFTGNYEAGNINRITGFYEVTSSFQNTFFEVYSHSDFLKNFDIAYDYAIDNNCYAKKLKIKCKAIKKFIPYEGFYPAQRTVQIAEKFRDVVYPNCKFSGSATGFLTSSDPGGAVFFGNIMTPMFAPGILYNSIKSGIAVDYPIHTSSLSIANGGINIYNDDFYIQEHFAERIPFEALLQPNIYLSNKEIHCSNPHPSGNFSGSATYNGVSSTEEYEYAMHNFLAETANFFLKDQNFSFIASERSDILNINLQSGSVYGFNIQLYKSQNFTSDRESQGGPLVSSLLMTGSDIRETFTMYSNPQSFGPPSRITSSTALLDEHTSSYSNLGYNWAFTPPYYDGISEVTFLFNPSQTRDYSIQEIFNGGMFLENRVFGLNNNDQMDDEFKSNSGGATPLNKIAEIGKILELYNPANTVAAMRAAGYDIYSNDVMLPLASLNVNLGIIKDVDLLDDDTSDTVKVAVDISSNTVSQLIIQPKWETPMFNFQHYSSASLVTLPNMGSQSAPRGMWHQYGAIETDPRKGVFMRVTTGDSNYGINNLISGMTGESIIDLSQKIGLSTTPVKLGKTAEAKVIREAIVAVPFAEYDKNGPDVEDRRKFFKISRQEIEAALLNKTDFVDTSVKDMVDKMQRYVMPPMFNFVEDKNTNPVAMYIFEFSHTLDQEDLAAIWQNLPPKIIDSWKEEEVTVSHNLDFSELLRTKMPIYNPLNGNLKKNHPDADAGKALGSIKWLVFKVKQKAEQNYYDKVIGDSNKTLNKTSPYSFNWPYDYFSLVELAKIEVDTTFANRFAPGSSQDQLYQNELSNSISNIPTLTTSSQPDLSNLPAVLGQSNIPQASLRTSFVLPVNVSNIPATPQTETVFDGPTPSLETEEQILIEEQPTLQTKFEKTKISSIQKYTPRKFRGPIK